MFSGYSFNFYISTIFIRVLGTTFMHMTVR